VSILQAFLENIQTFWSLFFNTYTSSIVYQSKRTVRHGETSLAGSALKVWMLDTVFVELGQERLIAHLNNKITLLSLYTMNNYGNCVLPVSLFSRDFPALSSNFTLTL